MLYLSTDRTPLAHQAQPPPNTIPSFLIDLYVKASPVPCDEAHITHGIILLFVEASPSCRSYRLVDTKAIDAYNDAQPPPCAGRV
jgi:hypothetical protein